MKTIRLIKILSLALTCAALVFVSNSTMAADLRANAGTTFTLFPSNESGVLDHTVDGIVQLSIAGNSALSGSYIFHADVVGTLPNVTGQPIALAGSFLLSSADGASTVNAVVTGAVSTDSTNPALANFYYRVTFAGGSGALAGATGEARIEGVGLFTSGTTGTATWTMRGQMTGAVPGRE
jgi:hypothetical protein